ncbi:MAG: phage terminase large subunit [Oscillospiraceae bacterium]
MNAINYNEVKKALARKDLFSYCNLKAPKFYKEDRTFLIEFCNELQSFVENDEYDVFIGNLPPRHGKSRTIGNLVEWVLGNDQTQKIMTGSYNETLSTTFSKYVRNTIIEEKGDRNKIVYSDIFPGITIKKGDGAMNMWSLENGYNNYLATSPSGTATGFGASILIIDDIIKNAEEANNAGVLEKHWEWFVNTMLSRLEEGGKIVIIMTRWHSDDLAGRALQEFKDRGSRVKHVSYKALQDDGSMLCPEILSRKSFETKKAVMGIDIVEANYQQNPIDIKGKLYTSFKTYTKPPMDDNNGNLLFTEIRNYTDTADTGDDYLCSIDYGVYQNEAYIINVLYTKNGMEITEPATAKMLVDDKVNVARIESNNGGRGFARNVEREMRETYHSNHCDVQPFHQSKNKQARILSNSTWVMNHIYFPVNWKDKFPKYYKAMTRYQREGKNAHDDAPDCTTGIAEQFNKESAFDDCFN